MSSDEVPDGVSLTNLSEPLFEGAGVTKRELVDYLDTVCDHILPVLRDRPLSVIGHLVEAAVPASRRRPP